MIGLPIIYMRKLAVIDSQYYHTDRGVTGPLVQLVLGASGEVSKDLERKLKAIEEFRAMYLSRETGQPVSDLKAGWLLGKIRRHLLFMLICQKPSLPFISQDGTLGGGR